MRLAEAERWNISIENCYKIKKSEFTSKWMETHEVRICSRSNDELIQWGRDVRFTIDLACYLDGGGRYDFTVHDIIVENGITVVNWGEINETVYDR